MRVGSDTNLGDPAGELTLDGGELETSALAAGFNTIDLVSVDSARSVTTELIQVEELIARRVDLIVLMSVDQKTSQTAAKLINKAGIPAGPHDYEVYRRLYIQRWEVRHLRRLGRHRRWREAVASGTP